MASAQTTSPFEEIDRALERLHENKQIWADLGIEERIVLLEKTRHRADAAAFRWVDAAVRAKGIATDSPLVGEEWSSGPWALLFGIEHLIRTLCAIRDERDLLAGLPVRTRHDGTVVVRVHPADMFDKLLLSGCEAEVWMSEGVTETNLRENMAAFYRLDEPVGKVATVLGAGNISSIAPLDTLYRLFAHGQVVLLKMNPVNDYLGAIFEEILQPFVDAGFLQFAYGGIDVGKYVTNHELVDEIHITGSERSFNAIVYGVGEDAERRKRDDEPLNPRPITSELGGVGPVIVVPGPWTAADLRYQAEHVATMKLHNGGFNCVAAQVLVTSAPWEHRDTFIRFVEQVFSEVAEREAYYPGALDRVENAASHHESPKMFGATRALLLDLPPEADIPAFGHEFFCSALAETSLPEADPLDFLKAAAEFANDRLLGTLGANIIIHPKTLSQIGAAAFEDVLATLDYGTIGVNAWTGLGFLLARAAWGAHPGHPRNDIESGQGFVHNALLFDKPLKTVVRSPFREFPASIATGEMTMLPRPPWFVTNPMAAVVMRRLANFSAKPGWRHIPGIFSAALRG